MLPDLFWVGCGQFALAIVFCDFDVKKEMKTKGTCGDKVGWEQCFVKMCSRWLNSAFFPQRQKKH